MTDKSDNQEILKLNYDDGKRDVRDIQDRLIKAATVDAWVIFGVLVLIPVVAALDWSPGRKMSLSAEIFLMVACGVPFLFDVVSKSSPGNMIYRLKIRRKNGRKIDWPRMLIRSGVKNVLLLGIELLFIINLWTWYVSDLNEYIADLLTISFLLGLPVCFAINVYGYVMVMKGKKAFHDRVCGTRVGV